MDDDTEDDNNGDREGLAQVDVCDDGCHAFITIVQYGIVVTIPMSKAQALGLADRLTKAFDPKPDSYPDGNADTPERRAKTEKMH